MHLLVFKIVNVIFVVFQTRIEESRVDTDNNNSHNMATQAQVCSILFKNIKNVLIPTIVNALLHGILIYW